jgi:hypothetical protein
MLVPVCIVGSGNRVGLVVIDAQVEDRVFSFELDPEFELLLSRHTCPWQPHRPILLTHVAPHLLCSGPKLAHSDTTHGCSGIWIHILKVDVCCVACCVPLILPFHLKAAPCTNI